MISKRLSDLVNKLPLKEGVRVLEIGCGPGVAAREIVNRFDDVHVLAIDRSAKAIIQAVKNSSAEIKQGKVNFIQSAIEVFELPKDEQLFDMAFAIRVGALDGRHPEIEQEALMRIAKALKKGGKLYVDDGDRMMEVKLR